jgi:hypothetical protein
MAGLDPAIHAFCLLKLKDEDARHKLALGPAKGRTRVSGMTPQSSALGTAQRSTHMAMPMPPPMQSVARPFLELRFCIS